MSAHDEVLAAAKDMLRLNLTAGTSGNVSGRLDDGSVVITPSSIPYDEMTLADLVVIDMTGEVVEGTRSPSSEKSPASFPTHTVPWLSSTTLIIGRGGRPSATVKSRTHYALRALRTRLEAA